MSDGMRRELVYLSSYATNRYFIPNWGKDYYDMGKGTIDVEYPAYTLWKLSLVQRFGKAVKLTAAIDNIFGYKPKYYYLNSPTTDGATFQIGMSIDIDKFFK